MQTRLTLKPGQRGTKRLTTEYGKQLVCVRYRYDAQARKRYKTIELIVDERAWTPRYEPETVVKLQVRLEEKELQQRVRQAGGVWDGAAKVWRLRYDRVRQLGLAERIVGVVKF